MKHPRSCARTALSNSGIHDRVEPDATAQRAFVAGAGGAGIVKDAGTYRASFWGFDLVYMTDPADREEALGTFLGWCDGLLNPDDDSDGVPNDDDPRRPSFLGTDLFSVPSWKIDLSP